MFRRLLRPWTVCLLLLLTIGLLAHVAVGAEPAGKTVRLLTVGNSFSRNATRYLEDLAQAGGHQLIHRPIIVGGASLQLHADKAQQHEQDVDDPTGLYANGRSLKQELQAELWDYVTIQQASIRSHNVDTYRPWPYATSRSGEKIPIFPTPRFWRVKDHSSRCDTCQSAGDSGTCHSFVISIVRDLLERCRAERGVERRKRPLAVRELQTARDASACAQRHT